MHLVLSRPTPVFLTDVHHHGPETGCEPGLESVVAVPHRKRRTLMKFTRADGSRLGRRF